MPGSKVIAEPYLNELASELIAAYAISTPPIDSMFVAREEGIEVVMDDFEDCFDARIEAHAGRFIIFCNIAGHRGVSRTRFSLAHELGHYFIDEHRRFLLSGGQANCTGVDFSHDQAVEREADVFAAALLMPTHLFGSDLNEQEPNLDVVLELAEECGTSIQSCALRVADLSDYSCATVLSKDGKIWYFRISKWLQELGCRYIRPQRPVPKNSATGSLWGRHPNMTPNARKQAFTKASLWFELGDQRDRPLYEESVVLPGGSSVLTFLSLPDQSEFNSAEFE